MAKFYDTCPDCGANLDPGETCDCRQQRIPIESVTPASREELREKASALIKTAESRRRDNDVEGAISVLLGIVPLCINFIAQPVAMNVSWEAPFIAAALVKLAEARHNALDETEKGMCDLLSKRLSVDAVKVEVRR